MTQDQRLTLNPRKVDAGAPEILTVVINDMVLGAEFGRLYATPKQFSTGSVGFYASGKLVNPASGERYQVSVTAILIGSKP